MIRPGFLDIELRQNLIELARDGSAAHRLARRANALVLLDDGMSCEVIAKVLLLDDDTIRTWYRLYEEDGIEGLTNFSYEGSACQLSGEQQEKLKAWVATSLPRTTRQVGAWIENEFGVVYEGRSGLIALLHRLGLEYHKPNVIPRKLDEEKQKAFIEGYEKLLNSLGDDEAVLFADAVHPTHAARPVGCWAPSQEKLAIEQTSGRQRINIHGAIDLETGQTRMIEALTIDAASTIRLLQSIEALYPMLALINVFLDNARYHHAKLVQEWLALPGHRRVGVQRANGIDPALIEKAAEQGARLRLYECILIVGFRRVNIRVGGYDIVIAGQHDRRIERIKLSCMRDETLHPSKLVLEFRPGLWIPVRCIERDYKNSINGCLEIAALRVGRIAGECRARDDWLATTC